MEWQPEVISNVSSGHQGWGSENISNLYDPSAMQKMAFLFLNCKRIRGWLPPCTVMAVFQAAWYKHALHRIFSARLQCDLMPMAANTRKQ